MYYPANRSEQRTFTGRYHLHNHMVSAWVAGNQLSLGQIKVDEKSNEIKETMIIY
jgi:hypothetical protein